jgi:hypothetical protein
MRLFFVIYFLDKGLGGRWEGLGSRNEGLGLRVEFSGITN